MKSKYINAEDNKKVKPNITIFFLSFIPINILIKNNKTHIAHGLNPSTRPIKTAITGKVNFLVSTVPISGIFNL